MLNRGILSQSFKMSIQNIKSNKMRSFLTMLGIIIGVASVIGLITIVQSVTNSVMGEFSGMGAGTLTVTANGTALKEGLSDSDVESLKKIDNVEGVSPTASLMTTAVFQGEAYKKVSVEGKAAVYFTHNADTIQAGRAFTEQDMSGTSMVCIVDNDFIKKVMLGRQVLGSVIKLDGYDYTIVGIKADDDSLMGGYTDTSNLDGTVMIPYKNALTMSGKQNVTSLEVYASGDNSSQVEKDLRSALDNVYNNADNSYSIFNMESLMDTMKSIESMMSTMLGGIASIALLVGGIGIMNMMLVSVSERTKEIGLRKALGAEPFRIQAQFLIESIVLSMLGGVIGVIFGMLIAYIASIALKTTFSISLSAIAIGVGFSAGVGIVFGWAPARRASRLNPIDALRSE